MCTINSFWRDVNLKYRQIMKRQIMKKIAHRMTIDRL